jgi:hypothetical protein
MSEKKRFVKSLRAAARVLGVGLATLSRWKVAADFPDAAHTSKGWNILVLSEYQRLRAARSLNLSDLHDETVNALLEKKAELQVQVLQLKEMVVAKTAMNAPEAKAVVEGFIAQVRQAIRNALRSVGGLAQNWKLHGQMEDVVFPGVLEFVGQEFAKLLKGGA